MINITFSPVRMNERLVLDMRGDTVIVNGESFDFSRLLEGATLPREAIISEWFPGDVMRTAGVLSMTIRLPHGPYAPEETRFPEPITIEVDGVVKLPPYGQPPEIDEPEESLSSEAQTDE
jgi:hypothetical protein